MRFSLISARLHGRRTSCGACLDRNVHVQYYFLPPFSKKANRKRTCSLPSTTRDGKIKTIKPDPINSWKGFSRMKGTQLLLQVASFFLKTRAEKLKQSGFELIRLTNRLREEVTEIIILLDQQQRETHTDRGKGWWNGIWPKNLMHILLAGWLRLTVVFLWESRDKFLKSHSSKKLLRGKHK